MQVQRREFNAQDFANCAWAFAVATSWYQPLFALLGKEAELRTTEFKAQNLANVAWAFVMAHQSMESMLFAAISRESHLRIGEFQQQVLANMT